MRKLSYVITVDENDVRIEKRPIGTLRFGNETEDKLAASRAEDLKREQMKLPVWFEALLRWGFRRVWRQFFGTD